MPSSITSLRLHALPFLPFRMPSWERMHALVEQEGRAALTIPQQQLASESAVPAALAGASAGLALGGAYVLAIAVTKRRQGRVEMRRPSN